jgi:hypothetical protein
MVPARGVGELVAGYRPLDIREQLKNFVVFPNPSNHHPTFLFIPGFAISDCRKTRFEFQNTPAGTSKQ